MARTLSRAQADTKPDMTPMLDIVFILLIFFIVTATFVRESGILPNLPKGSPPRVKAPDAPIAFIIDAANDIHYEGRLVDPWMAEAILKEESTARPKAPVAIKADKDSHTGIWVRLHGLAGKTGFTNDRIAVLVE